MDGKEKDLSNMKPRLSKERAHKIASCYIENNRINENRYEDTADTHVTFYKDFDLIEGSAWVVEAVERVQCDTVKSMYRATYVISDKTEQVERVINKGIFYLTHDITEHIKLNLTKEEAYQIVNDYIKTHNHEYEISNDIDDHIIFYDSISGVEGSAWLVEFKYQLPWGEPTETTYVVSDKTKQLVDILDDHLRSVMPRDEDLIPIFERLKTAFSTGTNDTTAEVVDDLQWDFHASYDDEDDDHNIENFDKIMEMLINYVIENKESEIVENVLDAIIDAQELQDTKDIDFSIFAQNLHTVTGESILLYIDILGNTNDPRYTPYLLNLKNHENSKVRFKAENALNKL